MRISCFLLVATLPAVAVAQPQTKPPTCDVTIVRAPEDVRPVVQRWIDAEPKCRGSLEVRIIPTDGGYYLIARDDRGRTNERVVPDAQSAGVLIASWAADDGSIGSIGSGGPAVAPPAVAPVPVEAPAPAPAPAIAPSFAPPMLTPVSAPFDRPLVDGAPRRTGAPTKWLTLGALVGDNVYGARLEVDLKHGSWWSIGLAGSLTGAEQPLINYQSDGVLDMFDGKAAIFAAAVLRRGAFELRGSIGAGLAYSHVTAKWTYPQYDEASNEGVFGVGDISVVASYAVNNTWGLAAGPVITVFGQNFDLMSTSGRGPSTFQRDADFTMLLGLRHRL